MVSIGTKALLAARDRMKAPQRANALVAATSLEPTYKSRPSEPGKPEVKKAPVAAAPPEPPLQKLGLVKALLSLGALRPACSILAKFPWMIHAYGDVADLVLRVMKVSLDPLADKIFASSSLVKFADSHERARTRYTDRPQAAVSTSPEARPVLSSQSPLPADSATQQFVFFYPDWTAFVPQCTTLEDLVHVMQPLMQMCGMQIHRDLEFVGRMCRIGRKVLSEVRPICPPGSPFSPFSPASASPH